MHGYHYSSYSNEHIEEDDVRYHAPTSIPVAFTLKKLKPLWYRPAKADPLTSCSPTHSIRYLPWCFSTICPQFQLWRRSSTAHSTSSSPTSWRSLAAYSRWALSWSPHVQGINTKHTSFIFLAWWRNFLSYSSFILTNTILLHIVPDDRGVRKFYSSNFQKHFQQEVVDANARVIVKSICTQENSFTPYWSRHLIVFNI